MRIVVDHLRGSRRGQRQDLPAADRLSIGRHPDCDIAFDAHRDLDASSRHAEIRTRGDRFFLCDVGSSNGTLVDGARVDEIELRVRSVVVAEFGVGGPQLRIWIGAEGEIPDVPPATSRRSARLWGVALVVASAGALGWWLAR